MNNNFTAEEFIKKFPQFTDENNPEKSDWIIKKNPLEHVCKDSWVSVVFNFVHKTENMENFNLINILNIYISHKFSKMFILVIIVKNVHCLNFNF